jgi:hypothetical protein
MEPVVIDDFLMKPYAQSIYEMMKSKSINWQFPKETIANYDKDRDYGYYTEEPTHNHLQFTHTFVRNNEIVSDCYKHLDPLFQMYYNCGFGRPDYTARIKANLLVQNTGVKLQPPHVDSTRYDITSGQESFYNNRITLLYYVNNSDGDTVIYNERYTGPNDKPGKLTVRQRVKPVKGRAVIFDSNQLHSSSIPTDKGYRIVINCVFGK